MLRGVPLSVETGLVGLVVAVVGAVISLVVSGQPLTLPVIISAVIAAALNFFTSSQRQREVPPTVPSPGPSNPPTTDQPLW